MRIWPVLVVMFESQRRMLSTQRGRFGNGSRAVHSARMATNQVSRESPIHSKRVVRFDFPGALHRQICDGGSNPQTSYVRCQELKTIIPPESAHTIILPVVLEARRAALGQAWPPPRSRSRRLPQVLARHRREMVILVIADVARPQHEEDLHPFRREGA